jgi:methylase of polypeptide subunit release factors
MSHHCAEPKWVSIRLFKVEDFDRSHVPLDPCTGFGRIAEAAKAAGYTVIAADIVDRG